jgi:methyl-accepting chemotaxis protein
MRFAVIAEEVRNLAHRCAQAAKDTTFLIGESMTKSNEGKVKVDHLAASIRIITVEAGRDQSLVDRANLGSQEQARGIEQIARAVTQMEKVTQSAAPTVEESGAAAENLNAQSSVLRDVLGRLTAMLGG